MEKEQRNAIQRAVKEARNLLEGDFGSQLLEVFDIDVAKARVADGPGSHLDGEQRFLRSKLTAAIAHMQAAGNDLKEALLLFRREMAFTALNRFVGLKLMEARALVHECVSQGLQSSGFEEFTGLAPALLADPEGSYQLFLQCLFEDVSREVKVLFDPRDPASLLWPRRAALLELLEILNRPELAELWSEDETIGWVYQYFNDEAERKKMRDESSAPRNSRELAVRNQFFTPRYVVEFLTDNTLGRIWYEMRRGETTLRERCRYLVRRPTEIFLQPGEAAPENATGHVESAGENLSQEELLREPVHIPYRPLKDPREILLLDPACGSMHFGLYAFDLFTVIYEEAWNIAHGSDDAAKSTATFAPFIAFAASFADMAAFLREVPRLIVEHNIHGIDIDPRATQIARLSLWLRAQRAWKQIGVAIADRPSISRTNVVCAEPMPGEKELLREFVAQEFSAGEQPAFSHLLETIFDQMTLAGEAGSLLRIEEDIRTAIADAKRLWKQGPSYEQASLFSSPGGAADQAELGLDLSGITDKQFWERAEQRIYEALQTYAEQAENGGGFKRRLFAGDAAQGFAFIDLCRKRYDAVVMNPPFGEFSKRLKVEKRIWYPNSWQDILAAFTVRLHSCLAYNRLLGAITSRTGFFLPSLHPWRQEFLVANSNPALLADLGDQVMDAATVESAAYILTRLPNNSWAPFFRFLGLADRKASLHKAVSEHNIGRFSNRLFSVSINSFARLRNNPLAYWVPDSLIRKLEHLQKFVPHEAEARQGLVTGDADRYVRLFWEVPTSAIETSGNVDRISARGFPYVMRGSSQPWFSPLTIVVNWANNGMELRNFFDNKGKPRSRPRAMDYYFRPGFSWTRRAVRFVPYIIPQGCIPSGSRYMAYPSRGAVLDAMGLTASNAVSAILRFYGEWFCRPNFLVEHLKSLPWITLSDEVSCRLRRQSTQEITNRRIAYTAQEPFQEFIAPAAFRQNINSSALTYAVETLLGSELDAAIAREYGVTHHEDDPFFRDLREAIEFQSSSIPLDFSDEEDNDEDLVIVDTPESRILAALSYAAGCAFGRWDIRYGTGKLQAPSLPDPFAPLPISPPGMLQDCDGLPLGPQEVRSLFREGLYPIDVSWDGILVDDQDHPLDFERRVHAALTLLLDDHAEELALETCKLLGVLSLRDYFRNPTSFFADHLKRYSKSRRQAPVYWPLSTGSGRYTVWLYYHRFTADTLYRVLQEYVEPRISQADRDYFEWKQQLASGGTTDAAQQLQCTQALLDDLNQLKAELSLVAPLWNPDLNDGVIINHAILWRLTPYAPWQKKVKECWDKLVAEEYDWAHLAFHLWPERVIPKCATDLSLAIAHGLDATFWRENRQGKWEPVPLSEEHLAQVVAAHTNHARSDALKRFLAAPPPLAATRARAPRSAQSASSGTSLARRTPQTLDPALIRQVRLVLTAAPPEGMAKATIAVLHATEEAELTAAIKQLKESGQIEQLGQKRGARYRLSPAGLAAAEAEGDMD
jgi:hypothetical protein